MTENLLEAANGLEEPVIAKGPSKERPSGVNRPTQLPEKFWDEQKKQVRVDSLIKSYLELERKLSSPKNGDVPSLPEEYEIRITNELLANDPEVNSRLHAAGFTREQAQLVYELAEERLIPMIFEVASLFEAESQIEQLVEHFGGESRWREVARQIEAWARARLPEQVFDALSSTYEGVLTMHRMMAGDEPSLVKEGESFDGKMSDADLRQMMRDPRYWRDQDPSYVDEVRRGFRTLYKD